MYKERIPLEKPEDWGNLQENKLRRQRDKQYEMYVFSKKYGAPTEKSQYPIYSIWRLERKVSVSSFTKMCPGINIF